MAEPNGAERYFLAAWPDETVRAGLDAWADTLRVGPSARRIPASRLHMTLVFLGALDAPRLEAVRAVAADTSWPGAVLNLDRIGYWKRSRIIWAGSRDGSAALSTFAETLRDRLRRLGFRIEERRFVPHVTLYRNAGRRPRWQKRVIEWRIDALCLVQSIQSSEGSRYQVLERWCASGDVE